MAPDRTWSVPGSVVDELIDFGDSRQVWPGRPVDGGVVALDRLAPAAPEVVDRLRRGLRRPVVESHPHVPCARYVATAGVLVRGRAAPGRGPRHRRPRPSRRARLARARRRPSLPVLVGLLAVLVAAGAGVTRTRAPSAAESAARSDGTARSAPVDTRPSETARWLRVLDGLDAVRSVAYERGDPALLTRVWAPGERLRIDTDQLRDLVASGCTAQGVRHRFGDLTALSMTGRRVRLRVVQWLPPPLRLLRGEVAGRLPGSAAAEVTVDLLATDEGWRLA
jgi:hypothetical protein